MRRTIPILSGLAILGVILNHSNWHVLRDLPAGDPAGYPYLLIDQVGKFAIVAFIFIAGYFIAYATNGGKNELKWSVVRARISGLVWPWLIWSVLMTLGQAFQGREISLGELLRNLLVQYYFIPLLIFYYLLAPLVVRAIRVNLRLTLAGALILQAAGMVLFYLRVYLPGFPPALVPWVDVGPLQYLRFAACFPLGLAAGMFPQQAKLSLAKLKPFLPWLALAFFGLEVIETGLGYSTGSAAIWPVSGDQTKLSTMLYAFAVTSCFITFEKISLPLSKLVTLMGNRSYGLYLSHYVILGVLVKLVRSALPGFAAQGWLLLPVLFLLTISASMLLMEATIRLPIGRFYRILFG